MKSSNIIGFAGRKRSGKGMLANGVKMYDGRTKIVTIADNLKFLCCDLLNKDYDTLIEWKDNGTTFSYEVTDRWVNIIKKNTGISKEDILSVIGGHTFTNVREMLQVIGTDLIRKFCPNWHIDKTIETIKSYNESVTIVVDDVRFPNEKKALEDLGGNVYFLIRPNNWDVSNHPSETALRYTDFEDDKIILNQFSVEDMQVYFNLSYFGEGLPDYLNPIFLSANPKYKENPMCSDGPENCDEDKINFIRSVIDVNMKKSKFLNEGIVSTSKDDGIDNDKFSEIILNGVTNENTCVYNPLTNETLKLFIGNLN